MFFLCFNRNAQLVTGVGSVGGAVELITTVPLARCPYEAATVRDGVTVRKSFGIGQMRGDQFSCII